MSTETRSIEILNVSYDCKEIRKMNDEEMIEFLSSICDKIYNKGFKDGEKYTKDVLMLFN